MSDSHNESSRTEEPKQLRGFYGKIKVSVATLDKLIIIGIIAIVAVLAFGMQHRGYTIEFDSMGGTPVESQMHMYNELLDPVETPTREGYEFVGWYTEKSYNYMWVLDETRVSQSMTLYARWAQKTS